MTAATASERTIGALLRAATDTLRTTVEAPEREAQILLAHVLRISRTSVLHNHERAVDETSVATFTGLIARRARGEPIAYLTGTKEFWSLELRVTPATLIPRPETETLVERALQLIPENISCRVADLGTGSGAIALAIAHERPLATVIATDDSAAALDVARDNAQRLNIRNVEFRAGNWFDCLYGERFFVIASNPPYVAADDPHLQNGDLRFEPRSALTCGGGDDLAALRHIADHARRFLEPGGWLLMEHGFDQGPRVTELLTELSYQCVSSVADLSDNPRIVVGMFAGE